MDSPLSQFPQRYHRSLIHQNPNRLAIDLQIHENLDDEQAFTCATELIDRYIQALKQAEYQEGLQAIELQPFLLARRESLASEIEAWRHSDRFSGEELADLPCLDELTPHLWWFVRNLDAEGLAYGLGKRYRLKYRYAKEAADRLLNEYIDRMRIKSFQRSQVK